MKGMRRNLLLLFWFLLPAGCGGYYFPNVYNGPEVSIYMPTWKNRTDRLGIDAVMYQSLSAWFQKADKIHLTKDKEKADLSLVGEIVSAHLHSIAWNAEARSTDAKVELTLRYVLKDMKTGKMLWEVPNEVRTESYSALAQRAGSEDEAVKQILEDVAEEIYLGSISRIRKLARPGAAE